jgi:hypothetical protein
VREGDPAGRGRGDIRNGSSSKTVLTEDGEIADPARSVRAVSSRS